MVRELDEEYRTFVLPERGPYRARVWFWGQVLRSFGSSSLCQRRAAAHKPVRWGALEAIIMDARHAVRGCVKAPGFTAVAIVTLGLGIGANAAIFSVVNAVLIRPLPYHRSEELVRVWPRGNFDSDIVAFFNERTETLSGLAAFND